MSTSNLTAAPGNEHQAQAWDGVEGDLWARHPEFFESSTRAHQARLMEAAALTPGERVLDIGCGTGDSTLDAARAVSPGSALGIDLSSRMLDRARAMALAHRLPNATFVHGDAQVFPFGPASFDCAISRTGSMFFADQVAAFTNIARALRPHGRLALVSWQGPEHNEWFMAMVDALTGGRGLPAPPPDAPSPFAHADPSRTEAILSQAGFGEARFDALDLPMYFGGTVDEGHHVLGQLLGWMVSEVEPPEREEGLRRLRASLAAHETPHGVAYRSSAWLITARLA